MGKLVDTRTDRWIDRKLRDAVIDVHIKFDTLEM